MARIGGSVFKDIPVGDFWIDRNNNPSPMMRASLVYNAVMSGMQVCISSLSSLLQLLTWLKDTLDRALCSAGSSYQTNYSQN